MRVTSAIINDIYLVLNFELNSIKTACLGSFKSLCNNANSYLKSYLL